MNIFSQKISLQREKTNIPAEKITDSSKSAAVLRALFEMDGNDIEAFECFYCLFLNNSNKVVAVQRISEGGQTFCPVPVGKIAQGALLAHANVVILAHNHPSGALQPSQADLDLTKKVKAGLALFDILVLDHIILTQESYYSFADNWDM